LYKRDKLLVNASRRGRMQGDRGRRASCSLPQSKRIEKCKEEGAYLTGKKRILRWEEGVF